MHSKAMVSQPGAAGYVIFDADYPTTIWETLPPPMLDDRPMTPRDPEYQWFDRFREFMPKDWLDSVKLAIEYGGIKCSETIEGLAEEVGLDPGKLARAVSAWNAKAAAGKPDEFGRLPQNMKPIRKAPFYGIKTGPHGLDRRRQRHDHQGPVRTRRDDLGVRDRRAAPPEQAGPTVPPGGRPDARGRLSDDLVEARPPREDARTPPEVVRTAVGGSAAALTDLWRILDGPVRDLLSRC